LIKLLYILIALIIISIIVIFHEFGHFIFARINGVTVNEFSLGMGPLIVSKNIKGTKFSLRVLPIGGSCMMQGEDSKDDAPGSFNSKNVWQRISIVLAGPVFNFILAFILAIVIIIFAGYDPAEVLLVNENSNAATAGLMEGDIITSINGKHISVGRDIYNYAYFETIDSDDLRITVKRNGENVTLTVPTEETTKYFMGISYSNDDDPAVVSITEDYPAEAAGIKNEDTITGINGTEINSGAELEEYFEENPLNGDEITVTYEHNGKIKETTLTPIYSTYYSLGFGYNIGREDCPASKVLKYSCIEVGYWIRTTVKSLVYMIQGHVSSDSVGGVVRVVDEISDSVEESKQVSSSLAVLNAVYWSIVISANLGVMNLLPLPALDGGRLLFMIIELFRGKPIDRDKEAMVHFIGIVLLMILMVFLFYNDIVNIFF
jgi:regulator of sigma E protease